MIEDLELDLADWMDRLDEAIGLSDTPLRRLASSIAELSDILIGKKKMIRYFEHEELLKAYGAFFFPQTFSRTFFVVREILERTDLAAGRDSLRVLDVGSGIGASLIAASRAIESRRVACTVQGIETVRGAAGTLRTLIEKHGLSGRAGVRVGDFTRPGREEYDLIVACASLSESGGAAAPMVRRLHAMLGSPGCLVIIEPSWRRGFDLVREASAALKQPPALPCLLSPACGLENRKDWCFASLDLSLPELTMRVNQIVRHNLNYVKFTYGVFLKGAALLRGGVRVISPLKRVRGKKLLRVCRGGKVFWLERLNKNSSEANRQLDDAECCDIVEFDCRQINATTLRLEKDHGFRRISETRA
ncbi:MAG: small ribosomal subunit Rsm22 family protein [Pseudomonadota bacterium]